MNRQINKRNIIKVEVKMEFHFFFLVERFNIEKDRQICKTDHINMIKSIFYMYILSTRYGWVLAYKKKKG